MSGIKITVPATLTDTSLPVYREDPILTAGSLWLADLGNEPIDGSFAATTGQKLFTNLAYNEAKGAIAGSPSPSLTQSVYTRSATMPATEAKVERTAKGGLHIIMSRTAVSSGVGCKIEASDAIKQHVLSNPGHGYYFGLWARFTRAGDTAQNWHMFKMSKANVWGDAALMLLYKAGWFTSVVGSGGANNGIGGLPQNRAVGSGSQTEMAVLGNRRMAAGITGGQAAPYYGNSGSTPINPPTTPAGLDLGLLMGGIDPVNNASTALRAASPSLVVYRTYLEDLTISGRSYATVDALDAAQYALAFNAGGRFNGDTLITDPASIA